MSILGLGSQDNTWLANAVIPKDIPLPLPAPFWLIVFVTLLTFLIHIVFVNFMVGGAIMTFIYEIKGLKDGKYSRLAQTIGRTITANKSLAVVFGVAPLLGLNTIYTTYFYTANALTANAWISIIPLVVTVFLLLYLHKYTWDVWDSGIKKVLHISIIAIVVAFFLFIPLIFLTNVTLMLMPDLWTSTRGFFSALRLLSNNIFARYAHFLLASCAMTGLFLVWYFRGKTTEWMNENVFSKREAVQLGYYWTLIPTLFQFIAGPIVLYTLPSRALKESTFILVVAGACFAVIACVIIWKEIQELDHNKVGQRFYYVLGSILLTLVLMISGRHMYRENSVSEHRILIKEKTEKYLESVKNANIGTPNIPEDVTNKGIDHSKK